MTPRTHPPSVDQPNGLPASQDKPALNKGEPMWMSPSGLLASHCISLKCSSLPPRCLPNKTAFGTFKGLFSNDGSDGSFYAGSLGHRFPAPVQGLELVPPHTSSSQWFLNLKTAFPRRVSFRFVCVVRFKKK